jgi:hypothetical protein
MATPRAFQWAIGTTFAESSYGTPIQDANLTDWYQVKEADMAEVDVVDDSDKDEITGYIGETFHTPSEKRGVFVRKAKASVELVEWGLSNVYGNVTKTGIADPFTNTIRQRALCTVDPPSFSIVEGLVCVSGSTGTYWMYKGCVIDKLVLEGKGRGPVQLTLSCKHDGSETAKTSFAWPGLAGKIIGTRIYGRHLQLICGPNGNEDLTSIVRAWKHEIDMASVEPPANSGLFVTELQYGVDNPIAKTTFTLKADKSHAVYGYFQNNTSVKCILNLVVNSNRSVGITHSQGVVRVKPKPAGSEINLDVTFMEEANATDVGPVAYVCKSALSTLLIPGS